jgi:hypothetical protein
MGVFNAIEGEKKPVLPLLAGSQKVLDPEELPLPDDR